MQFVKSLQLRQSLGDPSVHESSAQRRNQIYGPSFFDTDLTLMKNFRMKNFRIPRWEGAQFPVGAQAFNIPNHPNFDQPVGNIQNQFGDGCDANQHFWFSPGHHFFAARCRFERK